MDALRKQIRDGLMTAIKSFIIGEVKRHSKTNTINEYGFSDTKKKILFLEDGIVFQT